MSPHVPEQEIAAIHCSGKSHQVALLLVRVAEQACAETWRNIRDDHKQIKLAQLSSPDGTVRQVTEPSQDIAS